MGSADNDVIGMRIGEVDFEGSRALRLVIETDEPLDAKLLLLHSANECSMFNVSVQCFCSLSLQLLLRKV